MKKILCFMFAFCMLTGTLMGCSGGQGSGSTGSNAEKTETDDSYTATWKFAHNESERGIMHVYAEMFKKSIEEKSGGKINVNIYPSGTLGEGDAIIELLQSGGVEFALADSGYIGSFVPESQIFRAHFLLSNDMEVNKKLLNDSTGVSMLNEKFTQNDMKVLQHFSTGFTCWTANKPITSLADLKGLKMRVVPTSILIDMYTAYGANPTTVNYSELYSSLQLGVVEAQENPPATIEELKLNEVQSVATLSNHYAFIATCVTNPNFYDALPPDVQAVIDETMEDLKESVDREMTAYNDKIYKWIEEDTDMEVVNLTPDQRAEFETFCEDNREALRPSLGDSGMEILYQFEKEKKALLQ